MSKRSYGTGSVQLRGENSWRIRYYDREGKRHTLTFRGTKKQANDKLTVLLGDVSKGTHIAQDHSTLRQWAALWIDLKAAEQQHKTVARYKDLLERHVLPALGDRPIQHLKDIDIRKLYAGLTSLAPPHAASRCDRAQSLPAVRRRQLASN